MLSRRASRARSFAVVAGAWIAGAWIAGAWIAGAAIIVGVPATAHGAGPYDPALRWQTVVTPRFAVHVAEGGRELAVRVGRVAEETLDELVALFGYRPAGRIEIVLSDASDLANGSAQVLPKNTLRLFLTAPTELTGLAGYDDWLRILVIHELAHICDIDQTWGVTRWLRWVFGKYIAMNGFTPQFLTEGAAVYAETLLTPTGRGRSTFVDMILRMAALEDRFIRIDQAHVQFSDWPGASVAYFYGGRFHLWLAERFGRAAVAKLHRVNAALPIPYLYWFGANRAFGASLPALWEQWRGEVKQAAELVEQRVRQGGGETPSRRITFHGRNITGARYSTDGSFIVYSRTSPVDGSTVRRIGRRHGDDDRHLVLDTFSPRFSFSPDGKSFFYSQNAINERFNNYNDLYRYDLDADDTVVLKVAGGDGAGDGAALRARDPDVSPDGSEVVFVQNAWHQSWVSVGKFVGDERSELQVRTLIGPSGDTQHASPRYAPDGRRVAISTWFPGGQRDIIVVDADDGRLLRRVTDDDALDGNPAWSPDGRYLLYESDADGISNIYAFDTHEHRYWRVTRVVGGAFQPDVAPDGRTMLFRNASGIGFDIHEMAFDPSAWQPLKQPLNDEPDGGYHAAASPAPPLPPSPSSSPSSSSAEPVAALRTDESIASYSPWRTLLPFHDNWVLLPAVFYRNDDPTVSFVTLGQDVLANHTYQLSLGTAWYARHLDWSARYINDVWYPSLSIGAADTAVRYPDPERSRVLTAGVSWPMLQRHLLGVTYTFERRDERDPDDRRITDDFGRMQLGYSYNFSRRYPYSVGLEHGRGFAATLRWYDKALGSSFQEVLLTIDGRLYINNPLFDNHVLALRATAALALGPDYRERFYLGGPQGVSLFSVQTERVYPLRGFTREQAAAERGTGLLAAYAEYRLPLWQVERGLWTIPVYVERFHMAVFAEGGNTFGDGTQDTVAQMGETAWTRLRRSRAGAGTELRVDLTLGWAFPLTVRAGIATPVVRDGRLVRVAPIVYWDFGSAL